MKLKTEPDNLFRKTSISPNLWWGGAEGSLLVPAGSVPEVSSLLTLENSAAMLTQVIPMVHWGVFSFPQNLWSWYKK